MRLSATTVLFCLTALASSGCATMPPTGAQATREPLSVYTGIVAEQHQVQEKVGEVEHKASNGQSLGKSSIYSNRTVTTHRQIWYPNQGTTRIDDEDFFRIAGDKEAAERVRSYRETGVTMNRVGLGIAAVGIISALGGYYLMSKSMQPNADGTPTERSALALPLTLGGTIAFTTGGALTWFGMNRTSPDAHPVNDLPRAVRDADEYNKTHGFSASGGSSPVY